MAKIGQDDPGDRAHVNQPAGWPLRRWARRDRRSHSIIRTATSEPPPLQTSSSSGLRRRCTSAFARPRWRMPSRRPAEVAANAAAAQPQRRRGQAAAATTGASMGSAARSGGCCCRRWFASQAAGRSCRSSALRPTIHRQAPGRSSAAIRWNSSMIVGERCAGSSARYTASTLTATRPRSPSAANAPSAISRAASQASSPA